MILSDNDASAIRLPSSSDVFYPGDAIVSGWGTLTSGGSSPDKLRYVDVPLVEDGGMGTVFRFFYIFISYQCHSTTIHIKVAIFLIRR